MEAIKTIVKDNKIIGTFKCEGEEAMWHLINLLTKKIKGFPDVKVWSVVDENDVQELRGESKSFGNITYHWQFKGKKIDWLVRL